MPKPYSLSLYTSVLNPTPVFQRSLTQDAKSWKRSIRSNGGYWLGSFTMEGSEAELKDAFANWLGYHIVEKSGGLTSWEGMVYELDLTLGGITRRRSLDDMANRIKTTYQTLDFFGENLLQNAGFESVDLAADPADMDDFYSWTENRGTSGDVQASLTAHSGTYSAELTGDSDGTGESKGDILTYVRQNLGVTAGARYRLQFWTYGDGGANTATGTGRYGVRNPNAPTSWVVGPNATRHAAASWLEYTNVTFFGPSEGEVMIFFLAPMDVGRIAYFDDAELLEEGQCIYETEWAEVEDGGAGGPQSRYGVREEVIHLDNYPETTSTAYRDTYLAEHAWPWPRPTATGQGKMARLNVTVAGYIHTANWLYIQEGDGEAHDLDEWISLMAGTDFGRSARHGGTSATAGDMQFLKAGNIEPNEEYGGGAALQVPQLGGIEERPWDVIQELTALGDDQGNPFHCWADTGRLLHYKHVDTAPRYYLRSGGIYDTMAGRMPSNPWLMRPAVYRDMSYRPTATEPGSFLDNPRDMYVEEVTMADGWEQPQLTTELFSEAELIQARAERGA